MGQWNLSLNYSFTEGHWFTHFHYRRGKSYRAKIVHGQYHSSFGCMHNAYSLPSSWSIFFVEKHVLSIVQKWEQAAQHVLSAHCARLSGPVVLVGFTCWYACWNSSSLVRSLWKSSSWAYALFNVNLLMFSQRSGDNQNDWRIDSVNWLYQQCSLRRFSVCDCYIFTHQLHTTPHSPHTIICEMTFYFLFICSFPFQISSFSSFCTDLHSSWLFFWNASFFLFVILLILLVIQCLLLGNICLCVCVCVWNCMLYTEFSISTHWFS